MSRLSRTASAIRLVAARAVVGAQMTEPNNLSAARRTEAWRPCTPSNTAADLSNLENGLPYVDGASKQHGNQGDKQGQRELLLA